MGIVSFLNSYNTKKNQSYFFEKKLSMAHIALSEVFRTIATEKNQMFYPPSTPALNQHTYQASILIAAKHLHTCLKLLAETVPSDDLYKETEAHTLSLERAISAYSENKLALPQLLLSCSGIKASLERFLQHP